MATGGKVPVLAGRFLVVVPVPVPVFCQYFTAHNRPLLPFNPIDSPELVLRQLTERQVEAHLQRMLGNTV